MKVINLLFLILILSVQIIAQEYPEVKISDIQYISMDSVNTPPYDYPSPLNGDTVTVTGIVMNAPYRYDDPSTATLHVGGAAVYLKDTSDTEWSGIVVRQNNINSEAFNNIDTAMVVKVTGVVSEFNITTQLNLINFIPENVLGVESKRPNPVQLSISDFVNPDGTPNYMMEKYEGMYVEIKNVTTTDAISLGEGSFGIFDADNLRLMVGRQSDYIRGTSSPLSGTKVEYIRGTIETRNNISPEYFVINPIYLDDIQYGDVSPPNISNVLRDKGVVDYNQEVAVTARIIDSDGTADVKSAKLFYSINEAPFDSLDMTIINVEDSIWSGTIPAQNDSTLIRYYISAVDMDNAVSTNPSNTNNSYFYMTLDRPLTIKDVQYSPYGSGFSGYNGYEVTVSGRISADTSDIQGDGFNIGPQVYIQDGAGPWSGIQIFGIQAEELLRGTIVEEVTGIVNEQFGVTRIGTLDLGAVVKTATTQDGLQVEPTVISTADIGTLSSGMLPAESYEGVLVKIENVTVLDANADGNVDGPDEGTGGSRNFGEILIVDESNVQMRVELQDGTHDYHNYWDEALESEGIRIETGNTFESLTGILFFSFGNYKLVPRKNDDFVGHVTNVEKFDVMPDEYALSQNYPNPFNPTTTISYSIPKLGTNQETIVQLKIYDILGREVKTLVNEVKHPGNYKVQFEAGNLTSGIYFYNLTTGEFHQTKKLILLK